MTDIINTLAGIAAQDPLDGLRNHRAQAKDNAQLSFEALLEPEETGEFSHRDRYAVAAFAAGLLGAPAAEEFYRDLLRDEDEVASWAIAELLDEALLELGSSSDVRGPYGTFESAALAPENVPGPWLTVGEKTGEVLGPLLVAGLEFTHLLVLHPRDSRPEHMALLFDAGWDEDSIVTLAQLVSFLNFQIRISTGLTALVHAPAAAGAPVSHHVPSEDDGGITSARDSSASSKGSQALARVGERVRTYPELERPELFQQSGLGWVPWIAPVAEAELSDAQREALIEAGRANNPYFRLLARDPAALRARTLTDLDIFFNTTDGLGRAERELAATVASRLNGCLFCASIHSDRAAEESGRRDLVQALLDTGIEAPSSLGDPVWDAVVDASAALTLTPQAFGSAHVNALREAGLADGDIIDVLGCAAFFNWANRLMLSLGEPEVLARR
ncbi:MAG: alkylhydroperoxidase domain protein [Brevibacterium sp.]|nr:alkylhydroperoxidase domain protein [Brevibacterium sp.]MDN5834776.1 alkylhydroperoxidase domain protein [Brevibacterium sp.]MDN5909914.1 alkylhydroperoxidase domain protein [Brevibacterium sp.]MDN6176786.1 alkylhydroperoxidase domain protein [Brevibacterium sp.]MDN6188614.1 alkylhydroperoxidase domain protein [Brevibacterium sp.]